jgi:hypothetical protein
MKYLQHLTKRTWHSYTARALTPEQQDEVATLLLSSEQRLWHLFSVEDQRHSYVVMKRFVDRCPNASVEHIRAALLHDIGKTAVRLSTTMRVIATFIGPRTKKFRVYHDHERIGLELLAAESSPITLSLLRQMYEHENDLAGSHDPVVRALCDADNI